MKRSNMVLTLIYFCHFMLLPAYADVYQNTHEMTLENGLKIVVREDHRTPTVVTMVWYKVGSVDESRGLGGISHMLEHMMFKGTQGLKPNEHSRMIANVGGYDNAFTSRDYTAYFQTVPNDYLALTFELEADRMQNLRLTEEDFASERQVVAEERRLRIDSDPQSKFFEQFNAFAWTTHHYRYPVIGYMPDIQGWHLRDLQDWYTRFYAPNNATVVVVGDVKAPAVFALAKKTFGKIPSREMQKVATNFEVAQHGIRRMSSYLVTQLPVLMMAYQVPSINTATNPKDVDALIVLEAILDGTQSSRLSKKLLREQKVATEIIVHYKNNSRYSDLFLISAIPADGISLDALETHIQAEIERLKSELVTPQELKIINAQLRANLIYQQDSLMAQATMIGEAESTGEGWKNRQALLERLMKVTAEDIQAVARKYLVKNQLSIGTLQPLVQPEQSNNAE